MFVEIHAKEKLISIGYQTHPNQVCRLKIIAVCSQCMGVQKIRVHHFYFLVLYFSKLSFVKEKQRGRCSSRVSFYDQSSGIVSFMRGNAELLVQWYTLLCVVSAIIVELQRFLSVYIKQMEFVDFTKSTNSPLAAFH